MKKILFLVAFIGISAVVSETTATAPPKTATPKTATPKTTTGKMILVLRICRPNNDDNRQEKNDDNRQEKNSTKACRSKMHSFLD